MKTPSMYLLRLTNMKSYERGILIKVSQCASHVFDLAAAIPYHTMQPAERERYWDDHIHLKPAGYDLMGEKIAARLVELIMPPGRLQSKGERERPPRRKKVFRDDDRSFEEESGDDSVLGQGYYVVRWKDLE